MAVTIASSSTSNTTQADGRKSVTEHFTLSNGATYVFSFTAEAADDLAARLTADGTRLLAELVIDEIASNMGNIETDGSLAVVTLAFSTAAQNAAAIRAIYKSATRSQAAMIGDFLNTLTDAQNAAAFGITTTQAATLRTNTLVPAATLAANIRAAAGQ